MRRPIIAAICAVAFATACLAADTGAPRAIRAGDTFERDLKPGEAHAYSVSLAKGESALVVVKQMGADLVVEVRDPHGKVIASVDSPNGRNGDEVVLLEPETPGTYVLNVHTFDDKEPPSKYGVQFSWQRDAKATTAAVGTARGWLTDNSAEIPATGVVPPAMAFPGLDRWLNGVRVVGLGEATHGSRELGDLRLSLTKLMVERYGFRIVAIEASANKYRALAPYIAGKAHSPSPSLPGPGWIWIGQRTQRELIDWARAWNIAHPNDPVRIVGVDANDNAIARGVLNRFIVRAYRGTELAKAWPAAKADLAAADEQSFVFGDSGVSKATWDLLAQINADVAATPARVTADADAKEALAVVTEFAAFNADGDIGDVPRSRDVYMARRVLRALNEGGAAAKAIYWAHNAHVVHPNGATRIAGAVLRKELGAGYTAIATTFGEGGFVAQIPNDTNDRLAVSRVPMAPAGTVEAMLTSVRAAGSLALWKPGLTDAEVPLWFQVPRRMHWVGGLYKPDTNPADAFQPYLLTSAFDGVAYVPNATAGDLVEQRHIPALKR